jgi:uncharacterized membrane protein YfcA
MAAELSAWLLGAMFFAAAVLYSSVGHGGASGYLAVMGLAGMPPAMLRPTALVMNVAVASISLARFWHAARATTGTQWKLFWPFALGSVPLAYLGGRISLPTRVHAIVVGAVLLYSAWRLWSDARPSAQTSAEPKPLPALPLCFLIGGGIGLLSGLTGVGGGVFLSPILVLFGWANVRAAAAPTAAFILVNSIAGLAGLFSKQPVLPDALPGWVVAVMAGGFIGSWLGARKLNLDAMRRALAVVLLVAGAKMVF